MHTMTGGSAASSRHIVYAEPPLAVVSCHGSSRVPVPAMSVSRRPSMRLPADATTQRPAPDRRPLGHGSGDLERRVLPERRLEPVEGPVPCKQQRVAGQRRAYDADVAIGLPHEELVRRPAEPPARIAV